MADVPYNIYNHRREQCEHCPFPCEWQKDENFRRNGDNACPKGRFMEFRTFQRVKWKGAGDVVAAIAQPIAKAIDAASGGKTNVSGCGACRKRKEMLNELIPFNNNGM